MNRILFPVCCLFLCLGLVSAHAEVPPAAGTVQPVSSAQPQGLEVLEAYSGTWKAAIHYLDTPYSKVGDTTYQLRNDCWRSGVYYACDQFVGGESKALLVFTYDPRRGYLSYPITPDSGLTLHAGQLLVSGNVWTFPWQAVKEGKTTWFHVLNTWDGRDRIEFRQEYSADGRHWLLMAQGHETRVTD